jgi:hypothetical protein
MPRRAASRSDREPPDAPSIGGAIRLAAQDGYYNSWRLLPANVVWSVVAITIAGLTLAAPPAILLLPLLALPTAGLFRVTTRIARGESVSFWDAVDAWRTELGPTLVAGAGLLGMVVVLGSNVLSGLTSNSPLGWGLATLAGWGLLATWLFAWTLWPILVDPARHDRPAIERARLAGLLVIAHPGRVGMLGVVLAVLLAVSAIAIVALITVSVAFSALIASRFVLPAADWLEARLEARAASLAGSAGSATSEAGLAPDPGSEPSTAAHRR